MPRRPPDPEARQRWRNLLRNHREVLAVIENMGIRRKQITPYSPWQNGTAERWVETVRRDLLDHVIVLNERHLHRLLSEFVAYYHDDRMHLGLSKGTPSKLPEPHATRRSFTRALPRRSAPDPALKLRPLGDHTSTLERDRDWVLARHSLRRVCGESGSDGFPRED